MVTRKYRTLLFSYNPVPTPEYKTIEGSALRFWRMALGLQKNGIEDITIAIWSKFPQKYNEYEGIKIVNFDDDYEKLEQLTSKFDSIIFSCAMGPLSTSINRSIPNDKQIIIDAYSPMYVEFLTKSLDKKGDKDWLNNYKVYAEAFNDCLKTTDFSLIANKNQRHLYRGVLGATSFLPYYNDNRFIDLPAYVEKNNINITEIKNNTKVKVLWFGGIYPWFDIEDLITVFSKNEVKEKAQLTITGGSNPFYPKDNIRFNGKYINAVNLSKKLGSFNKSIIFDDWVEYDKRIEVFNNIDIAISVNNESIENDYSFRLRVADLAGNGVPIMTNGGDVLGEYLIKNKAAFRLNISSAQQLKNSILNILKQTEKINNAKHLLANELYEELHIDKYVKNLAKIIKNGDKPKSNRINNENKNTTTDSINNISTKKLLKLTSQRTFKVAKIKLSKPFRK